MAMHSMWPVTGHANAGSAMRDDNGNGGSVISFFVPGIAAPQGSKRHVGGGRLIESSKKVAPWRKDVGREATIAMRGREVVQGPVKVEFCFYFDRPKFHYGTGRNAGIVKPSAPAEHMTYPDLDKLVRATCDALTGIVWEDDSQVTGIIARKAYVTWISKEPGCAISVFFS